MARLFLDTEAETCVSIPRNIVRFVNASG